MVVFPSVAAALGTVDGIVLNGMNGAPIPGATLQVEGSETTFASDVDGLFRSEVAPGTYTVVVTKENYQSERIGDVQVTDGEVTQFSVILLPAGSADGEAVGGDTTFAEAITVTTEAHYLPVRDQLAETDAALTENILLEPEGRNTTAASR